MRSIVHIGLALISVSVGCCADGTGVVGPGVPTALLERKGDTIVDAPAADLALAKTYPAFTDKGPLIAGQRITIMTHKTTYRVGEPVRVLHVLEAVEAGKDVHVMGPKTIHDEYVDGKLAAPARPSGATYDGAVVNYPWADFHYEITTYSFTTPGSHTIQWKGGGASIQQALGLISNLITLEITDEAQISNAVQPPADVTAAITTLLGNRPYPDLEAVRRAATRLHEFEESTVQIQMTLKNTLTGELSTQVTHQFEKLGIRITYLNGNVLGAARYQAVDEAEQLLLTTTAFTSVSVGDTNQVCVAVGAWRLLYARDDRTERFARIYKDGTDSAKLFALCAFHSLDKVVYTHGKQELIRLNPSVPTRFECEAATLSAQSIITMCIDNGKFPDAFSQRPVQPAPAAKNPPDHPTPPNR